MAKKGILYEDPNPDPEIYKHLKDTPDFRDIKEDLARRKKLTKKGPQPYDPTLYAEIAEMAGMDPYPHYLLLVILTVKEWR
jgi:hypothetical protein